MLAKKFRLTRKEVSQIQRKGRRMNLDIFNVKFLPNKFGYARYAVSIPVKTYKRATDRNRLRRLIYCEIKESNITSSTDYLFSLYNQTTEEKLKSVIKTICEKFAKYPN